MVGNANITDTTNFYRQDYGYNLFKDTHSKIDLKTGIYGLDLKYIIKANEELFLLAVQLRLQLNAGRSFRHAAVPI